MYRVKMLNKMFSKVMWLTKRLHGLSLCQSKFFQECQAPLSAVTAVRSFSTRKCPPGRMEHLAAMKECEYDVLVIGGGATGAGCALDAATRGLKTALVDAEDFASGASSKSTKLIHGGVRYLQLAFETFNFSHFSLVSEALRERCAMLRNAPHLNRELPIMLPIYNKWHKPKYWLGLKLYDLLGGGAKLRASHFVSRDKVLSEFPLLRECELEGGIVYYDGQFDDARLCVTLIMTAVHACANVANYVEVIELIKEDGLLRQAIVRDCLSGEKFCIKTKCVINATGPFSDNIRQLEDCDVKPIVLPSSGTHIVLPDYFCSRKYGLVRPSDDGRVIFMLPWQGQTVAGTTDCPCDLTRQPRPTKGEVNFILENLRNEFDDQVCLDTRHVRSAWKGLRPLVKDPDDKDDEDDPAEVLRTHLVEISEGNLVTIVGGKWTTYRAMAEHALNMAIDCADLEPTNSCYTLYMPLAGSEDYTHKLPYELLQNYDIPLDVAMHLAEAYGTNSCALLASSSPCMRARLHCKFPYIEAEIPYVCKHEYACNVVDVIARRLRIAFLDTQAALEIVPRVVDIMRDTLNWCDDEMQKQCLLAQKFLTQQMGLGEIVSLGKKSKSNTGDTGDGKRRELNVRHYTVHRGVPMMRYYETPMSANGQDLNFPRTWPPEQAFAPPGKTPGTPTPKKPLPTQEPEVPVSPPGQPTTKPTKLPVEPMLPATPISPALPGSPIMPDSLPDSPMPPASPRTPPNVQPQSTTMAPLSPSQWPNEGTDEDKKN